MNLAQKLMQAVKDRDPIAMAMAENLIGKTKLVDLEDQDVSYLKALAGDESEEEDDEYEPTCRIHTLTPEYTLGRPLPHRAYSNLEDAVDALESITEEELTTDEHSRPVVLISPHGVSLVLLAAILPGKGA